VIARTIFLTLLLPSTLLAGDSAWSKPIVLQDPVTKVVFYLESDRRHVAAISPEGKLLWCAEIIRSGEAGGQAFSISDIGFKNKDFLQYAGWAGGGIGGTIDKKTGVVAESNIL
jgi:hypothetical protein